MEISRRDAIRLASVASASLIVPGLSVAQNPTRPPAPMQERPPAIASAIVQEFVIAGHSKLERVKEMLTNTPDLLNATHDWGGGDFESALEGAGHMGNREIALYLIENGARMSIFQAAMLGNLELVKAIGTLYPATLKSKGPHKITLLRHAERGGKPAEAVVEYLKKQGVTE